MAFFPASSECFRETLPTSNITNVGYANVVKIGKFVAFEFRGVADVPTAGVVVATLPEGFRPSTTIYVTSWDAGMQINGAVNPSGNITIYAVGSALTQQMINFSGFIII